MGRAKTHTPTETPESIPMCKQDHDGNTSQQGESNHLANTNEAGDVSGTWERNPCFVSTDTPDRRAFRLLDSEWESLEMEDPTVEAVECGEFRMELECQEDGPAASLRLSHANAPLDDEQDPDDDRGIIARDEVTSLEAAQDSVEFMDKLRDTLLEEAFELYGDSNPE